MNKSQTNYNPKITMTKIFGILLFGIVNCL